MEIAESQGGGNGIPCITIGYRRGLDTMEMVVRKGKVY